MMTHKMLTGLSFSLMLLLVCATAENTWPRRVLLENETMPAMDMTGNTTAGNATSSTTSADNRARRSGNGGDGRGNTARPQTAVCQSINFNGRKLLQPTETSTTPLADLTTTDGLASAPNATTGAANATGMAAMNATMGAMNATNVTGNATDDRSRRHSCSEGACGPPPPRYGQFGV